MTTTLLPILAPSTNGHHGQTGPKTLIGKMQSRANAVKHGFEAADDVFFSSLQPRERVAFSKIRRALRRFYEPETAYEKLIVDRMAIQHLRMFRLYRIESISMDYLPLDRGSQRSILPHLDRLSRYDVRIEKQLRILHNRLLLLFEQRVKNCFKSFPTVE